MDRRVVLVLLAFSLLLLVLSMWRWGFTGSPGGSAHDQLGGVVSSAGMTLLLLALWVRHGRLRTFLLGGSVLALVVRVILWFA